MTCFHTHPDSVLEVAFEGVTVQEIGGFNSYIIGEEELYALYCPNCGTNSYAQPQDIFRWMFKEPPGNHIRI